MMIRPPPAYIEKILEGGQSMQASRPVSTPGILSVQEGDDEEKLSPEQASAFPTTTGQLLWLSFCRSDLQYAVKEIARHASCPSTRAQSRLKRLLRYLRRTAGLAQHFQHDAGAPHDSVVVFSDSDWATGTTRRSRSGAVVLYRGIVMGTRSRTQSTIAQSSAEAELLAASAAAAEGLCLQVVLQEL